MEPHVDCYHNFDIVETVHDVHNSITLVGYWMHNDGEEGVDEIADFIVGEYGNYAAIRMKAKMVVDALNAQLNSDIE